VFKSATPDIVIGVGRTTDAGGNYTTLALLPGTYKLRAEPPAGSDRAFMFWNNQVLWHLATPITVAAGQDVNNIRFQLQAGGSIHGTVRHNLQPVAGADLDVFASIDSFIGALDAKTDANGNYTISAVPPGTYKLKASHPSWFAGTGQYWNHALTKQTATLVSVAGLGTTNGVDFDLSALSDAGGADETDAAVFGRPEPNPFGAMTRLQFSLRRTSTVEASVFDLAGRRVRILIPAAPLGSGVHAAVWDGRDTHGIATASGVYWLRIRVDGQSTTRKLVRTHR